MGHYRLSKSGEWRTLSIACAVVLVILSTFVSPMPAGASSSVSSSTAIQANAKTVKTSDGSVLIWDDDSDTTAKITGYVSLTKNLVIPSEIEGKSVIALGDLIAGSAALPNSTFAGCTELETVYLPDSIRMLSGMDFEGCTNLRSVRMSPNIIYIGMATFSGCSSLESIELPVGLTSIDLTTFSGCASLKSVTIPASVTSIGAGAFGGCERLEHVTFEGGLSIIGGGAFEGTAMTRVDLPGGLTSIGATAFRSDTLEVAYVPGSVDEIGDEAFGRDVLILTDEDATQVRYWARLEGNTYIAGNLAAYDNVKSIRPEKYNGSEHRPELTLRNSYFDEFPMEFATVTYTDNVNAGTATYLVTSDVVSGALEGNYQIEPISLFSNGVTVSSIPTQYYAGEPLEPKVEVFFKGKKLVEGVDYKLTYSYNDKDYGLGYADLVGMGNFTGTRSASFEIEPAVTDPGDPEPEQRIVMHRLYNKWSGEHLYTADSSERDNLVSIGWTSEGEGWVAPTSGDPVYRLFNPYAPQGDHHYTLNKDEYDSLVKLGWSGEGVAWYSAGKDGTPLWRLFNPYATSCTHHYTTSLDERGKLMEIGWKAEGVAWYGL